jgi:hypothetical protein
MGFQTEDGVGVPALTTAHMREVDRAAVEEFGLGKTRGAVAVLALPKIGLQSVPGELYLADIGILPEVYHRVEFHSSHFPAAIIGFD